MKRITSLIFAAALLLTACGGEELRSDTVYAMDTVMELTACGPEAEAALEAAKTEIYRLDGLFDRGNEGGEIYKLNQTGSLDLSEDSAALLRKGVELRGLTGGAFDMTVAPIMDVWGFYGGAFRVPEEDEIARALETVGGEVSLDCRSASLEKGVAVDVGGLAKGYASDKIMEIFKKSGITSGLVSLGGNVQALGSRPDGSPWRVAVQAPENDGYAGILSLTDAAAVTSGDYQRYFEENGKRYHHIIDPATGYPADNDLRSVTVVCPDGATADGLSTALFVMGLDRALAFWRENGGFEAIFIDEGGKITATAGLRGSFDSDEEVEFVE